MTRRGWWMPRTLRAGHTTARALAPRKTGHLIDTTEGRVNSTGPQGTEGELVSTATYASYVTDGTRPHEITPRRGRTRKGGPSMLRWEDGNGVHFAKKVMHPGTQPDPYMAHAEDVMRTVLDREVQAAMARWARIVSR